MLVPHIFGGWPVTSRISATSSRQSLRRCSLSTCLMNAAGLAALGVVLISGMATNTPPDDAPIVYAASPPRRGRPIWQRRTRHVHDQRERRVVPDRAHDVR